MFDTTELMKIITKPPKQQNQNANNLTDPASTSVTGNSTGGGVGGNNSNTSINLVQNTTINFDKMQFNFKPIVDPFAGKRPPERVGTGINDEYYHEDNTEIKVMRNSKMFFTTNDVCLYKRKSIPLARTVSDIIRFM